MGIRVIGKCSLCGGDVTMQDDWYATVPQKARCQRCHATEANRGPTIPMVPAGTPQVDWPTKPEIE